MKGAVTWFAENHVAANLLMLFLRADHQARDIS
jgi:hypothetical protein